MCSIEDVHRRIPALDVAELHPRNFEFYTLEKTVTASSGRYFFRALYLSFRTHSARPPGAGKLRAGFDAESGVFFRLGFLLSQE